MSTRQPWMHTAQTYRACELCSAGQSVDGERRCTQPQALPQGRALVPVQLVRSPTGACGPDARFLDFPGLNP